MSSPDSPPAAATARSHLSRLRPSRQGASAGPANVVARSASTSAAGAAAGDQGSAAATEIEARVAEKEKSEVHEAAAAPEAVDNSGTTEASGTLAAPETEEPAAAPGTQEHQLAAVSEPGEAAESASQQRAATSAGQAAGKQGAERGSKRPKLSVEIARERGERAKHNRVVLRTEKLTKIYGSYPAANEVSIEVRAGSFTGIVGPNGAGKTTTLSMISGLLRPTSGKVFVGDVDVWGDAPQAKRLIGSLPDRLRLFDRLTGAQLLYYAGVLQGVDGDLLEKRSALLTESLGLTNALGRIVADYSAGMRKKIALACSMLHAPDLLVLDEPFEDIDPVSAANVTEILEKFVAGGGSVIMSSHNLELIQRVCDHVCIISSGVVAAQGTVDEVRAGKSLEERFSTLTADLSGEEMEWLRSQNSD